MLRNLWWRLIRLGFHLLYNELAWTYDVVSWLVSLGQWRRWQLAGLAFVTGPRVLEIAHGPGHMLIALADQGYDTVGVDLSPYMSRLAQRRLRRTGNSALLLRGRAQALPFRGGVFDTVYTSFPTDFIADPETLTAVQRVLRPGGRLVIVPEGHLRGSGPLHRFINWLFQITGQRGDTFAVADDGYWPRHTHAWQQFDFALRAAGLQVTVRPLRLRRSAVTVVIAVKEAAR
jgi:ubiquinone/menaquinone biosynthesis C-methylase UbiE